MGRFSQRAALVVLPFALKTGTVQDHAEWRYWDVVPDLAKTQVSVAMPPTGAFLQDMVPKDALVAINGGYFQKDYKPTGWLVDKVEWAAPNTKAKRGGVLTIFGKQTFIGRFADQPFPKPDFAVQNSPLLLEPDGTVGIKSDDGRRAPRTVVCLEGTKLHMIVIAAGAGQGPTLMETAKLLPTSFKCTVALNLDGGPSTGIWFPPGSPEKSAPPPVPIGYGLYLKAR